MPNTHVQGLDFILSLESADVETKEQHYEDFSTVKSRDALDLKQLPIAHARTLSCR